MRPSFLPFALLPSALGCRSVATRRPADCPGPPAAAGPADSAAVAALAGVYDLVTVNTARGYGGYTGRGRLRLAAPDSAHRYAERFGLRGLRRVWRPLAGRYEAQGPGRTYVDTAEVTGRALYVGCVVCNDGSPTVYAIRAAGPAGFSGTWVNRQTGIGVAVDRRGRPLPNPEGLFCARRVGTG